MLSIIKTMTPSKESQLATPERSMAHDMVRQSRLATACGGQRVGLSQEDGEKTKSGVKWVWTGI